MRCWRIAVTLVDDQIGNRKTIDEGTLDKFDLNMCKACATAFKKRFGHEPGRLDAAAPVEEGEPEEVF